MTLQRSLTENEDGYYKKEGDQTTDLKPEIKLYKYMSLKQFMSFVEQKKLFNESKEWGRYLGSPRK